jgi:redox-sensitive bicupin YhaK (pirin superfamily)
VWIHQQAWFHLGKFDDQISTSYLIKKSGNGVYAFVLNGEFEIDGKALTHRDGLGIWDTNEISIKSKSDGAEILLMEVPMR